MSVDRSEDMRKQFGLHELMQENASKDRDIRSMKQFILGLFLLGVLAAGAAGAAFGERDAMERERNAAQALLRTVAGDYMRECHYSSDGTVDGIVYRRVLADLEQAP